MVLQLRLLETYYNDLTARESILSQALLESKAALSAVSVLSDEGKSEVVVPIGAGLFLPATYDPKKKLLVRLGANVILEKDIEEASSFLNRRMEEIERVLREVMTQKEETARRIEMLRSELEKASKR